MEPIKIAAPSTLGGGRLFIYSMSAFVGLLLFTFLFVDRVGIVIALLYIANFLAMFTAWAKLAEPQFFLVCDEVGVHYQHRFGCWTLPWQSFKFCAIPQFSDEDLAFIAFKVTDYDAILTKLPLRLAVRIMTEQRPLFLEAVKKGCADGRCASDLFNEKDTFTTTSAQYSGIKAVFAQRMQKLADASGFELFVPVAFSADQVQQLCQHINQTRLKQLSDT